MRIVEYLCILVLKIVYDQTSICRFPAMICIVYFKYLKIRVTPFRNTFQ